MDGDVNDSVSAVPLTITSVLVSEGESAAGSELVTKRQTVAASTVTHPCVITLRKGCISD
jgi:hypothetical protein